MLRGFVLILVMIFGFLPAYSNTNTNADNESLIRETYKLQGIVEYDDNPVETIYLDENVEKPQVNIPKRSLCISKGCCK